MWNPGDIHGQYELVRRLDAMQGEGGTWEAIRTDASGTSERVCLRCVLHFEGWDERFVHFVEREVRAASTLHHANIANVLDFGRFGESPYVAFEFVDGVGLSQLLSSTKGAPWPQQLAVQMGLDLAQGIEHAHRHGVVHGSIHPGNVLLNRTGDVKLTDFGIAAPLLNKPEEAPRLIGWPTYKSREVHLMCAMDQMHARADLFALGVALFEMLAGRNPFESGNVAQSLERLLKGEHPPLAELAPDTPKTLSKMVDDAIEYAPDRRPISASSMVAVLQQIVMPGDQARTELTRLVHARMGSASSAD